MKRFVSFIAAITLLILIDPVLSAGQKILSFSLKQAQDYAYENNATLKNSNYDVQIASKMVKQNTAIGLPQVDAGVDYVDFINIPTSLIPGEFFSTTAHPIPPGTYIPLKFGLEYNATVKAKLTQLIYSGQYLVGLQTAKAYLETARQKNVKDKMDIRDQVAEAYISFLILEESVKILDSTYQSMSQMVDEAKAVFKQGLIEDIDVDQLELNKSNLEASLTTTRNQRLIAYNLLKFLIGVKEDQQIKLTDNLNSFLEDLNQEFLMNNQFDYNSNITYKMLQKQEYLVLMQYKLANTAYHPTLAGFIGSSSNAQRSAWNFFDTKQTWFNTTSWGLSLSIPIWSSGSRKYSVDQARLNVEKMKVSDEQLKTSLQLQVETQRNDFNRSYMVFQTKKKSLETSNRIYSRTVIKYRKGLSTSTDLNQRYSQFLISESEYIQAMFDLLRSRIRLATLLEKV